MRKAAFEIAVGAAIVALAAANPFVGEHKDKNRKIKLLVIG